MIKTKGNSLQDESFSPKKAGAAAPSSVVFTAILVGIGIYSWTRSANGPDVALSVFISAIFGVAGLLFCHYLRVVEVINSTLKRDAAELRKTIARLEDAVEGIAQFDAGGIHVSANAAYARTHGYDPAGVLGMHLLDTIAPQDRDRMDSAYRDMASGRRIEAETQGIRADGSQFHKQLLMIPILDGDGRFAGLHCFMKDISERKSLEANVLRQAFHDNLTGLPNRTLFHDRVQTALARAQRQNTLVGVLFIDLDNFKYVNDSLGHKEGDRLLITVATRLRECVRLGDTVARLGGDEFTVLLENVKESQEASEVADRIVKLLREPVRLEGQEVFCTASIGIAICSGSGDRDALLRDADTAMYEAKTNGKAGYTVFEQWMNDRANERLELESGINGAIENGEFRLYYQPIIEMETGNVLGAEALVRWEHPTLGLISPAKFVPLADETGQIVAIGNWVLKEACLQLKEWQDDMTLGDGFAMNVNLSGRQLACPDLIEFVSKTIEQSRIDPSRLMVEVPESVMLKDFDEFARVLNALKQIGIKLAVDNFGTGYSSLSQLRNLPLDTVKIDQSFIKAMGDDVQPAAIVLSVLQMCRALDISVTSEGIETAQQHAQLLALGCELGQGYYFAMPMVREAFEELLRAGKITHKGSEETRAWSEEDYLYLAA